MTSEPQSKLASRAALWGLLVFVVALAVRLAGIGWGLPNERRLTSLHPDEPVVWLVSQQLDLAHGDFDPGFYNYGTLYLTLENVATQMTRAYGGGPKDNTREAQLLAVGRYHLAGRRISALAGAGLAWLAFAWLRRIAHPLGTWFGTAAIVFAPGLVIHSRFQTVDMLATLLLGLSLFYAAKPFLPEADPKQALRCFVLSGLFAGLSAGTKYTGILALAAIVAGALLLPRELRWKSMFGGVLTAMVAFLIATPGALLNSSRFWTDFTYEMSHTASGHGSVFTSTPSGFFYQAGNLIETLGFVVFTMGLVGLVFLALERKSWVFGLLAFCLLQYVLIGRAEVKFLRYCFPLVLPLAIGFGHLVGYAHTHLSTKWRLAVGLGALGLAGVGGGGIRQTITSTSWMLGEDPRDAVASYLRKQDPGAQVGLVSDPWFYTGTFWPDTALPRFPSPPFYPPDSAGSLAPEFRRQQMLASASPHASTFTIDPAVDPAPAQSWDYRLLGTAKPDYIVYSSFESDDPDRISRGTPLGVPKDQMDEAVRYRTFYNRLRQDYQLEVVWGGDGPAVHDVMYVRPRVYLWKRLKATPSP